MCKPFGGGVSRAMAGVSGRVARVLGVVIQFYNFAAPLCLPRGQVDDRPAAYVPNGGYNRGRNTATGRSDGHIHTCIRMYV